MILVTVGMTKFPFNRLLDFANKIAERYQDKKIVVQSGRGKLYSKKNLDVKSYLAYDELVSLISKAEVVISHGGPATIYLCLKHGKKPLVMPRRKKFGEQVNDHQVYFTNFFEKKGLVKEIKSSDSLQFKLKKTKWEDNGMRTKLVNKLVEYTKSL